VVCLNLMDEAERKGMQVDHEGLSRDLGVPVIPTTARYGRGLDSLMRAVADVIEGKIDTQPYRIRIKGELQEALDQLIPLIEEEYPELPNSRWVALRLLDGDYAVRQALVNGDLLGKYDE